jgi:hypothetical protein
MSDIDISFVTKYIPKRLESLLKLTTERLIYNCPVMWECLYRFSDLIEGGSDERASTA